MKALLAVLLCVSSPNAPAINNPGFEKVGGPVNFPVGWHGTSLPGQGHLVRYEVKSTDDSPDSRAMHITVSADHPERQVVYNVHQDLQGLSPGKTYRVSAMVKTQGLQHLPFVCAQCLDSENKFLTIKTSPGRELSVNISSWERVETEVTVPENTQTVKLRIGISSAGNAGGTAVIDNVEIVELP